MQVNKSKNAINIRNIYVWRIQTSVDPHVTRKDIKRTGETKNIYKHILVYLKKKSLSKGGSSQKNS